MSPVEIAVLASAAVVTSMLTVLAGAGGGTVLIAIMLQFMPPAAAIPVHGAIHVVSNCWRVWLFRRHLAWQLIWRFALLMPIGAALGLLLFQGLPLDLIRLLIGCFIVLTLFTRQLKQLRDKDLPLWAFVPLGFFTGALNMIVGVIAPILGVLAVRNDLSKEQVVGTLGVFGFIGNLLKVVGFSLVGFSFVAYGPALLAIIPAVILGTSLGKRALGRVSEATFRRILQVMLLVLAAKLIVYDSGGWIWSLIAKQT